MQPFNNNGARPVRRDHNTLDLFPTPDARRSGRRANRRGEVVAAAPALAIPVFTLKLVRERDHRTDLVRTPADAARVCCELLDGLDRKSTRLNSSHVKISYAVF